MQKKINISAMKDSKYNQYSQFISIIKFNMYEIKIFEINKII